MEPIINIQKVSKKYKIYRKPIDRVKEILFFGRRSFHQNLWALKDINLVVRPGESIGFVGSNGAGKSTLLRMISGISRPTVGSIEVRGRISALMELGAGFHYEFTGRENIYMNCSILGMTRQEIDERIDDIIAFAELGDFIDRPIKIYSTGMFMRLGFSVAINTDPDILLIDEILAVGDEYFQSKCYQKIKEFRECGKTVIFVSHAVNTLRGLCARALWIDKGQIVADGNSVEVTDAYLNYQRKRIGTQIRVTKPLKDEEQSEDSQNDQVESDNENAQPKDEAPVRQGTKEAEIYKVEILDEDLKPKKEFMHGETLVVRMHFRSYQEIKDPNIGVSIWRNDNVLCYGSSSAKDNTSLKKLPEEGYVDFIVPNCPLMSGDYEVSVAIFCPDDIHPYDFHNRLYTFKIKGARRDEGVVYITHKYRYVYSGGKEVIEKDADPEVPRKIVEKMKSY